MIPGHQFWHTTCPWHVMAVRRRRCHVARREGPCAPTRRRPCRRPGS